MRKKLLVGLIIVIFTSGIVGTVNAALITYDFTGSTETLSQPYVMEVSGLSLSISADGGALHRQARPGLGVAGDPEANRVGDGEELNFDFAPEIVTILESVVFERGRGGPSTFDLYGDNVFLASYSVGGGNRNTYTTVDFSPLAFSGSLFEFRGTGGNGFRIQSLTVDYVENPEPATMLLFGTGLAGFIGSRIRRKKQQ